MKTVKVNNGRVEEFENGSSKKAGRKFTQKKTPKVKTTKNNSNILGLSYNYGYCEYI